MVASFRRAWIFHSAREEEWSPLSLRFHDREKELGFLKAQKPFLLRRVQSVGLVGLALGLCSILLGAVWVQPWDRTKYGTDLQLEVQMITFLSGPACIPLLLVFLACVYCKKLTDRVGSVVIEVAATLTVVVVMVVVVLSRPANVARLKGAQVSEVLPYASDSALLLCIDGIVTAAHLGSPIRWFILVPLEVVGVLLYVVVIAIGASEPEPFLNVAFLAALILVASIGKRHGELGDRQAFLKLIQEKTLRCEAEFQLAQVDKCMGSQELGQVVPMFQADLESSAPTNKSGSVFSANDKRLNVQGKLARVAEIGRSEHWLIGGKSIQLLPGQVLGRGGFGIVMKAIMNGIVVAVKVSNKQLEDVDTTVFEEVCNEMRVLRHLRHPNIVAFHGAIIDPLGRKMALVLECVKGVLLEQFILEGEREGETLMPASTTERFQVLLGTCSALLHMHSLKPSIVHSDLKSRNVMVELFGTEVRPKLLDFGLARVAARGATLRGGTLPWMAPEALTMRGPAQPAVDVYSFGHMINFVSTSTLPPRLTRQQRRLGRPPPPLPRPQGCRLEPVCGPLADDCLRFDETARPSMGEAYRRLLALPQSIQLPGASPGFLEDLRILAEGLQNARNDSQDSESNVRGSEGQRCDTLDSADSQPWHGASLPALPEEPPQRPSRASEESADGRTQGPTESAAAAPETLPSTTAPWRPCPRRPATRELAMLTTLVELASTWNIERRRPPCCELHAAARVVEHLCAELRAADCTDQPLPRPRLHCPECGLLNEDVVACDFCGEQLQRNSASSVLDQAANSAESEGASGPVLVPL